MDPREYAVNETLRDGSKVLVRAQRPDDREQMEGALQRMGEDSIQRRFFAPRHGLSPRERAYFLEIDFVKQVALVAVAQEEGRPRIVGGGRYVVGAPGTAEVAFAIVDAWQGRGLGKVLMKHVAAIARERGLEQLVAEVLPENAPMLSVFRGSGLQVATRHADGVIHVDLHWPAAEATASHSLSREGP